MAKIRVGDKAPDFSATTQDGSTIRLGDYLGQKALVLFFYPKDNSPICTKEACSFRDSYEQFIGAGAEVIGVSSDSADSHKAFAKQHQLSFPLISDEDGSLRKLFGVSSTLGLLPGRATYVIDTEGIVRLIFSAQFASDEHVRKALQAVGPKS
jgi:peroxiredoxin Q/BCP